HDKVGVIAFDSKYEWIVGLQALEDRELVKTGIGNLGAGGGTRFLPSIEEAYFALGSVEAAARHIILLTDGVSTDPVNSFPDLTAKLRASGITLSTVAVGHGADVKLLGELARQGGGRYSFAATAKEVPKIFVKEAEAVQHDAARRQDTLVRVAT